MTVNSLLAKLLDTAGNFLNSEWLLAVASFCVTQSNGNCNLNLPSGAVTLFHDLHINTTLDLSVYRSKKK
jgi:hypothetical protein